MVNKYKNPKLIFNPILEEKILSNPNIPTNQFERVLPGDVTKETIIPDKVLISKYLNNKPGKVILEIMYMDPLGKISHRSLMITSNKNFERGK